MSSECMFIECRQYLDIIWIHKEAQHIWKKEAQNCTCRCKEDKQVLLELCRNQTHGIGREVHFEDAF